MSNIVFTFKNLSPESSSVTGMFSNEEKVVVIPSEDSNGVKVTKIENSAFRANENIEELIIPDTVKSIGNNAFENCINLKKVSLPKTLNLLGNKAFKHCNIQFLVLPEIHMLDFAGFSKNSNATFVIKNKITIVKSHAFNDCAKLVCLLSDRQTRAWDSDWSDGVKSYSDSEDDIPDILEEDKSVDKVVENEGTVNHVENDATNKQELFDQNIEVDCKNGVIYAKALKLSFPVKHLLISNIPVLQSAQLSFYQKFIILLLEKGIKALDSVELVEVLSATLNISRACVEDFVNYLIDNSYLDYDKRKKQYSLCKDMHFSIKPELNNAMFAELDTKMAECNRIVYLREINKCYLEDDFNSDVFRRKGNSSNDSSLLTYDEIENIKSQTETISALLSKYFEKTNMHIKSDLSFDVHSDKASDYQIEFDALLQYSYNKETKISKLFNTVVLKDNFLPKDFIDSLSSKYEIDKELPRFLGMEEEFYDLVTSNSDKMDKTESIIEKENEKVQPLVDDLEKTKVTLNELKKANKAKRKDATDKVDEVKEKIKTKDDEIAVDESLISKSTVTDEALINNLKKTIKDLKKDKEKLEIELSSKNDDVVSLEKTLKQSEEKLTKVIDEKEEAVSKAKAVVRNYEKELKEHGDVLSSLLTKNKNKTNDVIKNVIQKYPADKNIFNRYVTDIVIWLDSALSASESNAVDEIARCIDNIREMYRKVMQIVFDTLLNKKEMNLGSYMTDSFNLIELEKMFKNRGVNIDVKQRLVMFHEVANAIGHLAENGPKKSMNLKRLTEFKKMGSFERGRIILAIPDFFNSIVFNVKETDTFIQKLTIK